PVSRYCEAGQKVRHEPVFGHVGVPCLDSDPKCNSITYTNTNPHTDLRCPVCNRHWHEQYRARNNRHRQSL
ncbi:MAG TPA: hypothetical protein VE735_02230, partial [Gammaproteobacteria bacterium]|nr:hypothetical protein [Gammaproteobacteria bacterium]